MVYCHIVWYTKVVYFPTVIVKDKKCSIKDIQYQSKLMDKSNVISSFRGISNGLFFCAIFFFSLSLSVGKRSTLAKI